MQRPSRPSRQSRQSANVAPVPTLEYDAVAVALQEALGGRVVLIRTIGEGGMGRVYLGRDPQLKRFVAVKVLIQSQGADAEAHARFQREAQAIAAVSHPNVVAIYGVGELPDGTPYFIMQHVAGGSMAERLVASGPLPVDVAESVLGDVAAALSAAHRRGIVHRDVKPANVLWDEESERATVSDFGIASLQTEGEEMDIRITGSGMAVGSPAYMSPEQLLTEPVTPKSDIYALGLLGYELLTARGPYNATTPHDIVAAHLRDRPRRLSEVRHDIPEALQELLLRCLSKDPVERPTADEVMLALTPGAADVLEWPPPGLERLRGALWKLTAIPALGTAFLLLPLLVLVATGRAGVGESVAVPLLVSASALLGFVAFVRGARQAWLVGRTLARAARLKYGRGTLAEVMSDPRGDTGSLIAGTREYSTLSIRERSLLRALRVLQAVSFFLAAPAALLTAIVALSARGGQNGGDEFFVNAVLFVLFSLAVVGVAAGAVERVRLSHARRLRAERPRRTNEKELAPAWYAAFERSREGQWFGPGNPIPSVKTVLLIAAGSLAVLSCAAILFAASTIIVSGQILSTLVATQSSPVLGAEARRDIGGVAYRVTPDRSITPTEAGEALLTIASTRQRRAPSPIERRVSADYPIWTRAVPPDSLFPKAPSQLWMSAAILAAGHGLSPAQRTFLQTAAAHPAREEFTRAASAPSADVYGALLKLPLSEPLTVGTFPVVNLIGVRDAAESHAARVALEVADTKTADAERHAREIIAVGAQLLDMPFVIHNRIGALILNNGVGALEAVFVATGRERDARMVLESIVRSSSGRRLTFAGMERYRRELRDTTLTRGTRLEALGPLLFRACADPRQMFFGADESYRRVVTYARDSLARYPSERAWVDIWEGVLTLGDVRPPADQRGFLLFMARKIDGVVGGRRFESCASMTRTFRVM